MVSVFTEGLLTVLTVVGMGPGGVLSEYMCQPESIAASSFTVTVPPGATAA